MVLTFVLHKDATISLQAACLSENSLVVTDLTLTQEMVGVLSSKPTGPTECSSFGLLKLHFL